MFDNSIQEREKAVIVAADTGRSDFLISIKELKALIDTAGADVIEIFTQKRDKVSAATYIGSGKLIEIKEFCEQEDINFVVFDCELTPALVRNIQQVLDMPVLDRTTIILDIFANRAVTNEGKLQVELAQLKYSLPRLRGLGVALSRLGGGVGTRGPGETKMETDRRHITRKIDSIKLQLDEINSRNELTFKRREKNGIKVVSLVGYTNAGKSTLLNALTNADVYAEDKLFATLDTTTRSLTLPDGEKILISDTVGFIRNLPTQLINAFKSTLNQIVYSDLVVIVCDSKDEEMSSHIEITQNIINDLGYEGEIIIAYNKCDDLSLKVETENEVVISAKNDLNLDLLCKLIQKKLNSQFSLCKLRIPYSDTKIYYEIKNNCKINNENFDDDAYVIEALLDFRQAKTYADFITD